MTLDSSEWAWCCH